MSAFLDLVRQRRSCRAYTQTAVAAADLDAVLEAARLAPSACNKQPWRLMVAREPALRTALCAAYQRDWLRTAPCIIVGLVAEHEAWVRAADDRNHADVDLTIAIDHLTLAAVERGLGTCWIGAFDPAAVTAALDLPADLRPAFLLPLGHPAAPMPERPRRAHDELIGFDALPAHE